MISPRTRDVLADLEVRGIKLGLGKVRSLLRRMDCARAAPLAAQVAGTNGKGSVVFGLEAIARSQGLSTGAFVSPHLVSPTERIRIDGADLADSEFDARVASLAGRLARWAERDPELASVTHFEFLLALAVEAFREHRVDLAILEVGMGGRLDATTAVPVDGTCITSIALDHEAFLGPDLASIAGEKAGIARPDVPLLSGPLPAPAREVVRARADEVGAPLTEITAEPGLRNGMWGSHQEVNAALALALAGALGLDTGPAAREALGGAAVPGRCEVFPGNPEVLVDGAHNPAAAAALARVLKTRPAGGETDLLIGVGRDKDAAGIVAPLMPLVRHVYVTQYREGRAPLPAAELARTIAGLGRTPRQYGAADEALDHASAALRAGDRLLITGSLYLVGELYPRLQGRTGR